MCIKSLYLILVYLSVAATCVGQEAKDYKPTFTLSTETTHKIRENQQFTFGYLEVPENRNEADSRMIQLPVYIFKSRNPDAPTDPIIYTVGGPGNSTMPSSQYMNYYEYLDDRDFILIEQRGTYYAKPHLDCPEWSRAQHTINLPGFDSGKADSLLVSAANACRQRLINEGVDLNGYNTNEIAADVNDLVTALDIKEYNLLTISYSTKIAQVLMRDYPDRIRSVVLDSPLPLEVNYDEESVKNLVDAMDRLLTDCETDPDCNSAFPNIKDRFHEYLIHKTKEPLEVNVLNPGNGATETFLLTGADLITVFTSASTADVSNVPMEINKLMNGDESSVQEQLSYLFEEPGIGAGLGMRLSVWCAEEHPFSSQEIIESESISYEEVVGLSPAVFDDEVCKIWGVSKVAAIENEPVISNIPVLLISGEYDNETPVVWAEAMTENLRNSYHLIFKGWKHTPTTHWSNPCAMHVANQFFNNPAQEPKLECFEKINTPEFNVK